MLGHWGLAKSAIIRMVGAAGAPIIGQPNLVRTAANLRIGRTTGSKCPAVAGEKQDVKLETDSPEGDSLLPSWACFAEEWLGNPVLQRNFDRKGGDPSRGWR